MLNLDEPDPLPTLLPLLSTLHSCLQQCRFPSFWALYKSEQLETLRDNYTVECVDFEDCVREVVVKSVQAAFTKIGVDRLGSYLDLRGEEKSFVSLLKHFMTVTFMCFRGSSGADLLEFATKHKWSFEEASSSCTIPLNVDNHPEVTVIRENIKLPRMPFFNTWLYRLYSYPINRADQDHFIRCSSLRSL